MSCNPAQNGAQRTPGYLLENHVRKVREGAAPQEPLLPPARHVIFLCDAVRSLIGTGTRKRTDDKVERRVQRGGVALEAERGRADAVLGLRFVLDVRVVGARQRAQQVAKLAHELHVAVQSALQRLAQSLQPPPARTSASVSSARRCARDRT